MFVKGEHGHMVVKGEHGHMFVKGGHGHMVNTRLLLIFESKAKTHDKYTLVWHAISLLDYFN